MGGRVDDLALVLQIASGGEMATPAPKLFASFRPLLGYCGTLDIVPIIMGNSK